MSYKNAFNGNIQISLGTATKILAKYPASAKSLMKIANGQSRAEKTRHKNAAQGVEVPPLMIVSTTTQCNLNCVGCYANAQQRLPNAELPKDVITQLLNEATGLGVSIVMLAGGEPLMNPYWMEALGQHPELLGILFTNGTLIDTTTLSWFDAHRSVIPTLSLEGSPKQTDTRRGAGVYDQVVRSMTALHAKGIPFGLSITMTSSNMDTVLNDAFLDEYIQRGCVLFILVEYVPIQPGSEPLLLSKPQKQRLNTFAEQSMRKHPILCIPFPGDEEPYGGCLAAGRGFIHINANGDIEPCPFAPFSDQNLAHTTLKEALGSKFLSAIRDNHHLLKEGEGGCALWNNREWLMQLLQKQP